MKTIREKMASKPVSKNQKISYCGESPKGIPLAGSTVFHSDECSKTIWPFPYNIMANRLLIGVIVLTSQGPSYLIKFNYLGLKIHFIIFEGLLTAKCRGRDPGFLLF